MNRQCASNDGNGIHYINDEEKNRSHLVTNTVYTELPLEQELRSPTL